MFGVITGLRIGTINQRDDGDSEFGSELHQAQRFPITFGTSHAAMGGFLFRRCAPALLRNDDYRLVINFRKPPDDCGIISAPAISVKFQEARGDPRNIVPGGWTPGVPRQFNLLPRRKPPARGRRWRIFLAALIGFSALKAAGEIGHHGRQVLTRHDKINQTCAKQSFGVVRILRRWNSGGLLNNARSDKSNLRAWFGDDNVAEGCEACRDAAESGIRQDGNEGKACTIVKGSCRRHFGHLHQGEHPLLDSCSSAGCHAHQGETLLSGFFEGAGDFLSHDGTHGAAQKPKIENNQDGALTSNLAEARGHRLASSSFQPGFPEPVAVGSGIHELQWVFGNELSVQLTERSCISQQSNPSLRRHPQIAVTCGTNIKVESQRELRMFCLATRTLNAGYSWTFGPEHSC